MMTVVSSKRLYLNYHDFCNCKNYTIELTTNPDIRMLSQKCMLIRVIQMFLSLSICRRTSLFGGRNSRSVGSQFKVLTGGLLLLKKSTEQFSSLEVDTSVQFSKQKTVGPCPTGVLQRLSISLVFKMFLRDTLIRVISKRSKQQQRKNFLVLYF